MSYVTKLIQDGPYGSYMADPNGATIPLYARCKFAAANGATPDGTAILQPASATERGDVVAMQPITPGTYGTVRFMNTGGEQFGALKAGDGGIAEGGAVYAAASGAVSPSTAGGAILLGVATTAGADGGVLTYSRNMANA